MAWEKRGGHLYYYKKKRLGNRVVSQYVGRGSVARFAAAFDSLTRSKRKRIRHHEIKLLNESKETDKHYFSLIDISSNIIDAILLIQGLHKHKGEWRGKRG